MKEFINSLHHLKYILLVYLGGLVLFTLFRLVLFISIVDESPFNLVLMSFWMGFRFDTVISGYLLAIPALLLIVVYYIPFLQKAVKCVVFWFVNVIYSLVFFLSAVDIPYYQHYGSRLNSASLQWIDSPEIMLGMVAQEISYLPYFVLWISVVCGFVFYHRFVYLRMAMYRINFTKNRKWIPGSIVISILFLGVILLAVRGRIEKKSPIRIGTAYFCNDAFLNQLGLNPIFTFIQSLLDDVDDKYRALNLVDENEAILLCKNLYNHSLDSLLPFERSFMSRTGEKKTNVVIVIMESMAMHKTGLVKDGQILTPFLDSLAGKSISYSRMYSAGIHTFNGLYATLFGYPALKRQHPMNPAPILSYDGLPSILKQKGYTNLYFGTHDDQFDNVGGFFRANGFDRIISQKDYPSSEIVSALGVPDHSMFRHSFKYLNEVSQDKSPFLAVFLTASDHVPYTIPEGIPFYPKSKSSQKQIVEYADWALRDFMNHAKLQPWYYNTLFVFLADHGTQVSNPYGFSLGFHHSPFLIFSPDSSFTSRMDTALASQIDVFPSICGYLDLNYTNRSPGMDLTRERRNFVILNEDDKLGILSDSLLIVIPEYSDSQLFLLDDSSFKNKISSRAAQYEFLKRQAFSVLQASQWMIQHRKTSRTTEKSLPSK
ncbi:MAG: sulfatase-like hydrolase/transferase [Bacteroidales bacterium]|nr:sulfatase-like hydrolase/transferase [Bacteroidales bacterium]